MAWGNEGEITRERVSKRTREQERERTRERENERERERARESENKRTTENERGELFDMQQHKNLSSNLTSSGRTTYVNLLQNSAKKYTPENATHPRMSYR